MLRTSSFWFRWLLLGLALLARPAATWAQSGLAPHGYDFLTVTTVEGITKTSAKLFLTPAFEGKTEVQLEDLNGSSLTRTKDFATAQRNTSLINQQLSALTVAGWELVQAFAIATASEPTTRYLFRKPRP